MGTGPRQRSRRDWWALGAVAVVAAVGAISGTAFQEPSAGPAEETPAIPATVVAPPSTTDRHTSPPVASHSEIADSSTAEAAVDPSSGIAASSLVTTAEPDPADLVVTNHSAATDPGVTEALTSLEQIPVKGRAPRTGYERSLFGPSWTDDVSVELGHNGCDTRNDILRRDLTDIVLKENSNGCVVLSGMLQDPYTGQRMSFARGSVDAGAIQIDHVVALSDAWQKGAQAWDEQRCRNFANDPANLQATDGTTNQRKGAGDAATWLPPNRAHWCDYVSRQTVIKATYGLWMTAAEKERIGEILTGCRDDPADTAPGSSPAGPSAPASSPDSPATSPIGPTAPDPGPADAASPVEGGTEYRNCTDVWQRHGGPILRGDPGYRSKFDGDDDGVGCENPPR